jgi:RimJ/RimL family protein N-acetyltransferase
MRDFAQLNPNPAAIRSRAMAIPRLETERLILRVPCFEDYEAYAAIFADPEVMRFLGPVMTRREAWRALSAVIGQWSLRGYGRWAVTHKSDGALLGIVGLNHPIDYPDIEVAWTLVKSAWGQGYATEAARAAMRYGFLTRNADRFISLIDPQNTPSQAVAARLGERNTGERHDFAHAGQVYVTEVWSISRAEWLTRENAA